MKFQIEKPSSFRIPYIATLKNTLSRENKLKLKDNLSKLFQKKDPLDIHSSILASRSLNLYNEAQDYPFSSLKYHLLLTCALYFNLKLGFKWSKLYLCENPEKRSEFQIIYRDDCREWALIPDSGMSRVRPKFYETWERRTEPSLGGENRILSSLLLHIGSWSAALAIIEEFRNN